MRLSIPRPLPATWFWSLPIFAVVGVAVYNYPLGAVWAALGLLAYAAVLWCYPQVWLPAVLASLPLLNFAPWTGWVLLDELDLLMGVTLAVRLLQRRPDINWMHLSGSVKCAIGLLVVSFFSSALVGLLPLSPLDHNALTGYYTSFNSLRVLKGFAWALALLPLLIAEIKHGRSAEQRFVAGMLVGLSGVVVVAIWQRIVFTGLLDFARDYRITATFPEMHTGGGYIETYLAAAIPFTVLWIMLKPGLVRFVAGGALFVFASYAVAVTFARAGYLGYAGGLLVMGAAVFVHWCRHRTWKPRQVTAAALVLAAGAAVVVAVLSASYMQSRVAAMRSDLAIRTQHWTEAASMIDHDLRSSIFGMGLGSFPRTYLFKNPHGLTPATFGYAREADNLFVRLGSGSPLYFGQRVSIVTGDEYHLEVDLRSSSIGARLRVFLCETGELYSFRCKSVHLAVRSANGAWERHAATINAGDVGLGSWPMRRPVVLALQNPPHGSVDVDNVRLLDRHHANLVSNGNFTQGGSRWFFSTDNHLPWHIKHLWIQIRFEQGWLGIIGVGFALLMATARLALWTWRGDLFAGTLLASLSAFTLLGFFDSTFDAPRLTTLFFILLFVALCRNGPAVRPAS